MNNNQMTLLIENFLKEIDWQKHLDNLEEWVKENASSIGEKIGVAKEWVVEHSTELKEECTNLFFELSSEFSEGMSEIREEWKKVITDINSTFEKPQNLVKVNLDFVNFSKLLQIIKENIVKGSNQAALYLKKTDKDFIFYICYLKDHNVLDNKENNHIIVITEAISRDVEQQFKDSNLIIIK